MSGLSDLTLWDRIQTYQLDKDTVLPFSARLARETGWRRDFAQRVCEEYKKFIYLACVSDATATPSREVDEAWHLHLVYTRDYWQRFCRETLGRDLHHTPTEGGEAEGRKFREAYELTLALYEKEVGEPPPADIWPPADVRFGSSRHEVDLSWQVVLPTWTSESVSVSVLVVLAVAAFAAYNNHWIEAFICVVLAVAIARLMTPDRNPKRQGRGGEGCGGGGGGYVGGGCGGGGCGGGG